MYSEIVTLWSDGICYGIGDRCVLSTNRVVEKGSHVVALGVRGHKSPICFWVCSACHLRALNAYAKLAKMNEPVRSELSDVARVAAEKQESVFNAVRKWLEVVEVA